MSKITRLKVGFAAGILVMLANAVIPYQTFAWLAVANDSAQHAEAIIAAANEMFSTLKDAEAAHRGYVLTGRREFLKTYEAAMRDVRPQLVDLHVALSQRPQVAPRMEELNYLVEERIRQMDRVMELRREEGLERSARLVGEGKGRQLMEDVRAIVHDLVAAERSRLVGLKREQERRSAISAYALALVAFLDLLVLGIVYYLVFRTIAERAAAENELRTMGEQLKAGLENLAARNRDMETFHRMSNSLQSCETMEEAHEMIARFGGQLLPAHPGSLYVLHPSRDFLEPVREWGPSRARAEVFEPAQCWALRRSQAHVMNDPARDAVCPHAAGEGTPAPYICVPLISHGDAIGLVQIASPAARQPIGEATRIVALAFGEQASLSMSNMRLRETLRQQSITDALTGLYNRRYLDETLRRELVRAARGGRPVAVIMLDVDHFKRFNDTHGHEAGDAVLRSLAGLMQRHSRGGDILCRYGGEEFAMIMPEMTEAIATERASRLLEAARLLNIQYGARQLGRITVSAGVAVFPQHAADAGDLLKAADAALYAAKKAGRDRVVVAPAEAVAAGGRRDA